MTIGDRSSVRPGDELASQRPSPPPRRPTATSRTPLEAIPRGQELESAAAPTVSRSTGRPPATRSGSGRGDPRPGRTRTPRHTRPRPPSTTRAPAASTTPTPSLRLDWRGSAPRPQTRSRSPTTEPHDHSGQGSVLAGSRPFASLRSRCRQWLTARPASATRSAATGTRQIARSALRVTTRPSRRQVRAASAASDRLSGRTCAALTTGGNGHTPGSGTSS